MESKISQDSSIFLPMPVAPSSAASSSATTEPKWTAEQILQGAKEALIVHGQSVYRLRLTRNGKLILHK